MFRLIRSLLLLVLIIALQTALYNIFIQPQILRWGASQTEADRAMPGDDLAPFISSTRAVTISAPAAKVWQWLVQLGADRSGFYSYRFLEEAMGYESRNSLEIKPEFQEMKVGRLVPGSMRESKSMIKYSWPVVSVDAGKSFVLKGWGCFLVESPGENQTRLIVRTHGRPLPDLMSIIGYHVITPLHYLMERRMLMGIKQRAEAGEGVDLPDTSDYWWFAGVALSALGLILLIFAGRGVGQTMVALLLGSAYPFVLLLPEPTPLYALGFLGLVLVALIRVALRKLRTR